MRVLKKFTLFAGLLYASVSFASCVNPWVEIKPSYFFFCTSPMKRIYDHGGFEIQGSASIPVCAYLDVYGSVGYRTVSGNALNSGEKTTLRVMPIDFGLKPVFNLGQRLYYFFAIGPRYFHVHQHNSSPYVDRTINGNGIGLFANTGFNMLLADHFLLGIFGEYSYETKKIYPRKPNVYSNGSTQLGGLAFGISLGYEF